MEKANTLSAERRVGMANCKTCNFENVCTMPDFVRNDLKNCKVYEPKKKKTNFDMCCESIENMAQIIDIAKDGWTKEQIIAWLQSEAE
jgi:hypothetical protein